MNRISRSNRLSSALVSRSGAWVAIGAALAILTLVFGVLGGAEAPPGTTAEPRGSESEQVHALLAEFPDQDEQSVLLVASRDDGRAFTADDTEELSGVASALEDDAGTELSGPIVSDDGNAALLIAPITVGESNTETAGVIGDLREAVDRATPPGLTILVTGGPAFGADVASAFDGADLTLLLVTIAIVALLLILTYRSPVLWLVPLAVVAVADRLASVLTSAAAESFGLEFDAGIISVLVFGAGTNYALLIISRYREELLQSADHRRALANAWRGTLPAILASNVTVVLALLTLLLAVIPRTHGLGIASAIGLIAALVTVTLLLPPLLAVFGRRLFWPFIPKPNTGAEHGRAWRRIATRVTGRPALSLTAGLALLAVMASGLIGTSVGLDQMEKFRVQSESAEGLAVLSEHFPAGEAQPHTVIADRNHADAVVAAAERVPGVVRAHPVEQSRDGTLTNIMVTGDAAPGTPEALELVESLRSAVHGVPEADAIVGGSVAADADSRSGAERDLLTVAPLILLVSFAVLAVLLRSLVAPVLLLIVNLASAVAAIGAGSWLSRLVFGRSALDLEVPLLSFLFLVALGIDYTIFLVHRAREEAAAVGVRQGMVRAVSHTGSVITSAGVVLAAVFAALGVLPLVTLGQLGLIVGLGVLVDTLVVRTVIVPALFTLLGDRMWWPGKPPRSARESTHGAAERSSSGSTDDVPSLAPPAR